MDSYSTIIYSFLGLIVFILAIYLGILLNKLRLQSQHNNKIKMQMEKKEKERQEYLLDSLRIISLAVTQDQCEISEGCIRITKLLEEVSHLKDNQNLKYFFTAYEDFKEFPFLEDRKALSKQERFRQDNKRFLFEEQHASGVKVACSELLKLLVLK